jgi:hypothetical protein
MHGRSPLLQALGGEEGCRKLSATFYTRVGKDPVLRPFFPGKSLKCATAEFAAFLIQLTGKLPGHAGYTHPAAFGGEGAREGREGRGDRDGRDSPLRAPFSAYRLFAAS